MFWHYLKVYDDNFESIGANNNHIVMYKIPADIWIMNSDCYKWVIVFWGWTTSTTWYYNR